MSKTLKKTWNAITTVVVVLAVLVAAAMVGARLFGLQVFTVLSGSMEPAYRTGSLIYVKSVDYSELKVGDVITFMLNEDTVATHRIVEIVPDEDDPQILRFRTKGDANSTEDGGLVHCNNIIGTPVFTIPYLGYVANFIQTPPGLYYALAAGIVLILLAFLPDVLGGEKKKSADGPDPEPESAPAEEFAPAKKSAPTKKSAGRHSHKGRHEA